MDTVDRGLDETIDVDREIAAIEEARRDVIAGRVVPLKAVKAWVESIGTLDELPIPRAP
jgi:predicted transcriptional regulator